MAQALHELHAARRDRSSPRRWAARGRRH